MRGPGLTASGSLPFWPRTTATTAPVTAVANAPTTEISIGCRCHARSALSISDVSEVPTMTGL